MGAASLAGISLIGQLPFKPLLAAEPRTEFQVVLAHFRDQPEKLAAAKLLISEAEWRVAQVFPPNIPKVSQDWIISPKIVRDAEVLTARDLIDNIELAFAARKRFPWTADLNAENFNLTLPYRNASTSLVQFPRAGVHWRAGLATEEGWNSLVRTYDLKTSWKEIDERMGALAKEYGAAAGEKKGEVLMEVVRFLNTEIWQKEGIIYAPSGLQEKTLETLFEDKSGRCSNLTHLSVLMLRAWGIPAALVRVPAWARTDDNHVVAGVRIGGKWKIFDGVCAYGKGQNYCYNMGLEVPAEVETTGGISKLYVDGFGRGELQRYVWQNRETLPPEVVRLFGTRSTQDVTAQFTPTVNIVLEGMSPGWHFLSVLNNASSSGLMAVAAEKAQEGGHLVFKEVGCRGDNLYFVPGGPAVLARDDRKVILLSPSGPLVGTELPVKSLKIGSGIELSKSYKKADGKELTIYREYELQEWKDEGKFGSAGFGMRKYAGEPALNFRMQEGRVYALRDRDGNYGRPFLLTEGKLQIFNAEWARLNRRR